jgi:hypothetical protein
VQFLLDEKEYQDLHDANKRKERMIAYLVCKLGGDVTIDWLEIMPMEHVFTITPVIREGKSRDVIGWHIESRKGSNA